MQSSVAQGSLRYRMSPAALLSRTLRFFIALLLVSGLLAAPAMSSAETLPADAGLVALSDQDLEGVTGGEFELALEGFDILIADNEAGMFTMDIAQSAFQSAQGIFTTLQAVNSAVDLTVIVNIYVDHAAGI